MCRHAKEAPQKEPIRSPVFSRTRKGSAVTGRSPGSRVIIFRRLPVFPDSLVSQWHLDGTLAGHSCGYSAGLTPASLFTLHYTGHLLQDGRIGEVGCSVKHLGFCEGRMI
jgi:hypothetical protein